VEPHHLPSCQDQKTLGDLLAASFSLFEYPTLVKGDVVVSLNEDLLHLLYDDAIFLLEGKVLVGCDIFPDQDMVLESFDL
jgi:hypothetical protein